MNIRALILRLGQINTHQWNFSKASHVGSTYTTYRCLICNCPLMCMHDFTPTGRHLRRLSKGCPDASHALVFKYRVKVRGEK